MYRPVVQIPWLYIYNIIQYEQYYWSRYSGPLYFYRIYNLAAMYWVKIFFQNFYFALLCFAAFCILAQFSWIHIGGFNLLKNQEENYCNYKCQKNYGIKAKDLQLTVHVHQNFN